MNAEQLNGILARLCESHRGLQTMEKLQAVRSSLEQLAGSPADAKLQSQYNTNLQALNDILVLPTLNTFSVRETNLIEELSLDLLVGEHLRAAIRESIIGVAITPRAAFEAVAALHDKVNGSLKKINRVSTDLTELGVVQGGPARSEVELGLYIPRDNGNLSLEQVLEEGAELDSLVKLSYEAVEGKPQSPEVTYLTSCDYGYLLTVAPSVIWFLLLVIEKCLEIRRKWADDREHFRRSRELGHDDDAVSALEAKQGAKRELEIEDAVRLLVREQKGVDEPRKNEITTLMINGIRVFIERHERGSYIDVRVGDQPEVPEQATAAAATGELVALREKAELLQRIEQVSARIHALEQNKEVQLRSLAGPTHAQEMLEPA